MSSAEMRSPYGGLVMRMPFSGASVYSCIGIVFSSMSLPTLALLMLRSAMAMAFGELSEP